MTKLEEIAAAISSGAEYEWDLTPDNRAYWLGMARVAVEAMREPSEEMKILEDIRYGWESDWVSIINAILNEKAP